MEHNGQKFEVTRLDRKGWDHFKETGFRLEGKHHELKCEKCHNSKHMTAETLGEIKMKDPNKSFLGLSRECLSCHEDQHQGQLDRDCLKCHGQDAWKPAPGFNHDRTNYPLAGLHRTVVCQKCHGPKAGETKVQFKGLVSSGCQSCHNDPHRGAFQEAKFNGSCDKCHNTNGWKNNHPSEGFNHNSTKFPLTGKHTEVSCSKCHKTADFHLPIKHELCKDCHEDTHKGQFTARAAGSDCGSCHNDTAFKPAKFDRLAHQDSAFRLDEKHVELECKKCHLPEGKDAVYILRKTICSDCHKDKHGEEFRSAPWKDECNRCHTQTAFQPSTFTVEQHALTKFELAGKHNSVKCNDCHLPLPAEDKESPRKFHFISQTCNTCHADPHQTKLSCETCHTTTEWKEIRPFDHSTTKFKLDGAHQKTECVKCHPHSESTHVTPPLAKVIIPAAMENSKTAPAFPDTPTQCLKCHDAKDPHRGQFTSDNPKEDCSYCHVTVRWDTGDFNHDKAKFGLDFAHKKVPCIKCHKEQAQSDGKMMKMYRGTPLECTDCHK